MADPLRVAVLGAGLQGTTVALELARRGCLVDLYDRGARPITQAGLQNEGKLHLGFVYGNDPSLQTARRLAAGSLRFLPLIRRWAGQDAERICLSSPFIYAVPDDSLLPATAVHQHFACVEDCLRSDIHQHARSDGTIDYPGLNDDASFFPLPDDVRNRFLAPERIVTAVMTREIAVDPASIAAILRRALERSPRIRVVTRSFVKTVALNGDGYSVIVTPDVTRSHRPYDHVVNALWDGRLRIDRDMGLLPRRSWLWRQKLGLRIYPTGKSPQVASVTFTLGPYGDVVRYQDGHVYLSWYPAGLVGLSGELAPPDNWDEDRSDAGPELISATLGGLSHLYPDIGRIRAGAGARVEVVGGTIFAWGQSDIDDPDSELHRRYDIGVTSLGGYHSINTGKYCMAPLLAINVADRVVPGVSLALT